MNQKMRRFHAPSELSSFASFIRLGQGESMQQPALALPSRWGQDAAAITLRLPGSALPPYSHAEAESARSLQPNRRRSRYNPMKFGPAAGRRKTAGQPPSKRAGGWGTLLRRIMWRATKRFVNDDIPTAAASTTFYILLAFFPAVGAFVSL